MTADLEWNGPPDEAQTLGLGSAVAERISIKDGEVVKHDKFFIPEQVYRGIESAAVEELMTARDRVLTEYPAVAARSVIDRMRLRDHLEPSDVRLAQDMIELEIKRGIQKVVDQAQQGLAVRMPRAAQGSLIPLMQRSVKQ
jgi:hypothetical protein